MPIKKEPPHGGAALLPLSPAVLGDDVASPVNRQTLDRVQPVQLNPHLTLARLVGVVASPRRLFDLIAFGGGAVSEVEFGRARAEADGPQVAGAVAFVFTERRQVAVSVKHGLMPRRVVAVDEFRRIEPILFSAADHAIAVAEVDHDGRTADVETDGLAALDLAPAIGAVCQAEDRGPRQRGEDLDHLGPINDLIAGRFETGENFGGGGKHALPFG